MGFREKLLQRSVIWKSEVEVRVGKLKNGKASGKVEITGLIDLLESITRLVVSAV